MLYKKKKIGRNDKCPCGSGKKFKKCHLDKEMDFISDRRDKTFQQMEAKEYQRKEQQGLGREIISATFQGKRFVAVEKQLYFPKDKNWNTFHDFLEDYLKTALGADWGESELKKDFKKRHPVVQWSQYYFDLRRENKAEVGKVVVSAPHTGASMAFLGLAYNLYLLHHNEGVQSELIRRVKLEDMGNFYGAVYETYVAANFVKAGFDIEFENELDGSTSHCEFTAIHKETGRKFSVEAKTIEPKKKGKPKVVTKLNGALKKEANYEMIVFIDIGRPAGNVEKAKKWLLNAQEDIRKQEETPILNGVELPKAYVILTNNSYWHDLKGQNFNFVALGEGFQIQGFKTDYKGTIHDALIERKKHKEVFDLLESMRKQSEIPSTFDGENPDIAFHKGDDENPPLIIGNKYLIPNKDDAEVVATLDHVFVDEGKKLAIGAYSIKSGGFSILSCPLSDVELSAYKKHPRTFFGRLEQKTKIDDPLEFYDWVYSHYRNISKERLLEFMDNYPNKNELKDLSRKELVKIYCEGVTESATFQNNGLH